MAYRTFDPEELEGKAPYFLMTSLVVPRPIAWVSTLAKDGTRNLAPHSYFNVISSDPPIAHFTSTGVKDTIRNVRETGEFVINIVSEDMMEAMNITAARFPADEDEFTWADLEGEDSVRVKPQRVKGIKAALECELVHEVSLGNGNMAFGAVRCIHVDESVMVGDRIDPDKLRAVGRMGGSGYTRTAEGFFKLVRPEYEDLIAK